MAYPEDTWPSNHFVKQETFTDPVFADHRNSGNISIKAFKELNSLWIYSRL